ncbi:MAG: ornithine cyclodeaminase family protein, partial [Candidatus Binatia bacterium]
DREGKSTMALFLANEDVQQLLTMGDYIDAVEKAYHELGMGRAWNNPRIHTYGQAQSGATHFLKVFTGTVPALGYSILRIDSTMERNESGHETSRKIGNRNMGWLLLFSVETGQLEAIIEDRALQRMRVGAMTGIAAKYLAKSDSRTIGIFGSGTQAGPQLEALCSVMKIQRIKVYSPTVKNRENFAAKMTHALGTEVTAVNSPRQAVTGCDIVVVATNSNEPVFDGRWLEAGSYVSSIVNSDKVLRRRDLDDESFRRAALIVVSARDQIKNDEPIWLTEGLERGAVSWDRVWEIGELVCGKAPRRSDDQQITILKNNGLSVQFAGVGAAVMQRAKERGLGKELPAFMFEKAYRT